MLSEVAKQKILSELYDEEELAPYPYDDATGKEVKAPVGNLSYAIGWNIQGRKCPRPIAEFAAMYFVNEADAELSKALDFYDSLDEVRKVVLCDMGFNMGVPHLLGFEKMLGHVKNHEWDAAEAEMLNSAWAPKVGPKRSGRLGKMMSTGQWT